MIPISGEMALLASSIVTVGGAAALYGKLTAAARAAAGNEAKAVIRGDVGREEMDRRIQTHSVNCKFPERAHAEIMALADDSHKERVEMAATAHRELIEATVRIENAVNGQGARIDSLTGLLVEIARNGKRKQSDA